MTQVPFSGKLTSLAGRYAKTLFELAQESGKLNEIYQEFAKLCDLIKSSQELSEVVSSAALSRTEHQSVLAALSEKMKLSPDLARFLDILSENRRLKIIFDIFNILQEMVEAFQGTSHAEVISAQTLTKEQQNTLQKILSDYTAGNVTVKYILNPDHLGGIFVRMGNQVIDLTLATKLQNLATAMKGRA